MTYGAIYTHCWVHFWLRRCLRFSQFCESHGHFIIIIFVYFFQQMCNILRLTSYYFFALSGNLIIVNFFVFFRCIFSVIYISIVILINVYVAIYSFYIIVLFFVNIVNIFVLIFFLRIIFNKFALYIIKKRIIVNVFLNIHLLSWTFYHIGNLFS